MTPHSRPRGLSLRPFSNLCYCVFLSEEGGRCGLASREPPTRPGIGLLSDVERIVQILKFFQETSMSWLLTKKEKYNN